MADVVERKVMTVHTLLGHVEEFIAGNQYSRAVDLRWLACEYLPSTLTLLRQARSDNLDLDWKEKVNAFRLRELEAQRQAKLREIEEIDREAKRLSLPSVDSSAA